MSTKALSWAIEQRTGSPTRKLILVLLADLADEQHTCYPGREYLAARAELSTRAVSAALTALVTARLIRVLRRAKRNGGRRSNRYLLLLRGPDTPLPDTADWSGEFVPVDLADEPVSDGGTAGDDDLVDGDAAAGQGNREARAPLSGEDGNREGSSRPTGNEPPRSNQESRSVRALPPPPGPRIDPAGGAGGERQEEEAAAVDDPYPDAARVVDAATAELPWDRMPRPRQAAHLTRLAAEAIAAGWPVQALITRLTSDPLTGAASVYGVLRYRLMDLGPLPAPRPAQPSAVRFLAPRGPWCGEPDCDPTTRQRLDPDGRPRPAPGGAGGGWLFCTCRRAAGQP